MHKILIIEDDLTIAETLTNHLNQWGFDALKITDFQNIMETFIRFEPHLVLLDISLPFYNGFHWCAQIRQNAKTPIIFISSAGDNMNIIIAMNMGADDFIAKPFDLSVITAKIQALIRRTYEFQGQVHLLQHRDAILNLNDSTLTYQGLRIELTKNDFRILQTLMENPGKIVSRNTIMNRLWENDSFIDDNTLTVNMTRLRKKLEEVGLSDFIVTKKGLGYMVK